MITHPTMLGEHGEGDQDGDGIPDFQDPDSDWYKEHWGTEEEVEDNFCEKDGGS